MTQNSDEEQKEPSAKMDTLAVPDVTSAGESSESEGEGWVVATASHLSYHNKIPSKFPTNQITYQSETLETLLITLPL